MMSAGAQLAQAAITLGVLVAACRCVSPSSEGAGLGADTRAPSAVPAGVESTGLAGDGGSSPLVDAGPRMTKPQLPALSASAPLVSLDVAGFRPAIVSVPVGATQRRPVMVALHGNFDRPEWQCEVWRDITAGYPFVLCPRGVPRGDAPKQWDRWTYTALKKTEEELFAGLEALQKRFPDHADPGPVLYTGFSLGAIYGVHVLRKHPERFTRAVLTEGGYERWSAGVARAYAKGGGQRILFACGQTACQHAGRQAAKVLERESVGARVVFGGNIGHTYDGRVADGIAAEWPWLTGGDARWPGGADSGDAGD